MSLPVVESDILVNITRRIAARSPNDISLDDSYIIY